MAENVEATVATGSGSALAAEGILQPGKLQGTRAESNRLSDASGHVYQVHQ